MPRETDFSIPLRHGLTLALATGLALLLAPRVNATTQLCAASAFVGVWLFVPIIGRLMRHWGVVQLPGGRSIHAGHVPLLGGLTVFAMFAVGCIQRTVAVDSSWLGVLLGASLMLGVGIWDDLRGLTPRAKIAAQLVAGGCLLSAGWGLPVLEVPGLGQLTLGWFEVPVVLFWVILATNAFNLSDGLDGLASSLALVTLAGLVWLGVHPMLALPLAGAVLGFWPHNLPRARIFFGDAGSLFLGFVLAALLLRVPPSGNFVVAVGLLAYPLWDVGFCVLRRYVWAKPLFAGDKSHVHHKLRERLGSDVWAVGLIVLFAIFAAACVLYDPRSTSLLLVGAVALVATARLIRRREGHLLSMSDNRHRFRELHLVRKYVEGRLKLAREPDDVARSLERCAEDLQLASLDLRGLRIRNGGDGDPRCVREAVQVADGEASWAYLPRNAEGEAYAEERRTIVHELILEADRRLRSFPVQPLGGSAPDGHNGPLA